MIRKISILAAGVFLGAASMITLQSQAANKTENTYRELSLFGDIFERVRAQYVTAPDDKKLVENAINGMLTSLDPHSGFMNKEETDEMRVSTEGEFGGLGIEVTMENDLVKVVSPMDDTPASKAGVLAGDLIYKIDGQEVRGQSLNDAVKKMRGKIGEPIKLSILRQGAEKPIEITVTRDVIKVKAVRYSVENDIGYLRVIRFNEKTYNDLSAAIDDIRKKVPNDKLKGYVLDLRLNPGGLLDQAVKVSDAFLTGGQIVSTRGRDPKDVKPYNARPDDLVNGKPVIVLINGGSASASEIVAGALQDHRRATVLGTRSFGKGSVQTVIPLNDGAALRLTTALYYTPSGKSIQGKGITPDIIVNQPLPDEYKGYDLNMSETSLKDHIKGKEEDDSGSGSIAYVPREQKDDVQLNEAFKLLRGEAKNDAFPPDPNKGLPK